MFEASIDFVLNVADGYCLSSSESERASERERERERERETETETETETDRQTDRDGWLLKEFNDR